MALDRSRSVGSVAELSAAALRRLERKGWFATLTPALRQDVLGRCVLRRYATRSLVYAAGSPPGGFYVVVSGEVRLEHLAKSGKFAFYYAMGPGDLFGMLSEIDGSARFSDARAWAETTLLHLPHAECQSLYHGDPAAREAFVALICRNLRTTLDMVVEVRSAPPRAQIANLLVTIFSHETGDMRDLPKLTQEAIAEMAGVSRQTASKVLHEFRGLGLIAMQYGRVTPLDLAQLQDIARA